MKKIGVYLKILSLSLQVQLEYKMNFLLSFLFKLVPFVVNIFVWLAVSTIGKFSMSRDEIVTYYLFNLITSNMLICSIQYEISEDIRTGTISKYLIKPVSYMSYQMMKDLTSRVIFLLLGTIPVAFIVVVMRDYITYQFRAEYLIMYLLSLGIGYIINFFVCFLISELSFYFTNVSSVFATIDVIKDIISGAIFPLSLLPATVANGLIALPFSYIGYIPCSIMLGQYPIETVRLQMGIGILWCIALGLLSKLVWRSGLKKYAVFGG